MMPRENKNNAHTKFVGTNKEYYSGIFESGLLIMLNKEIKINIFARKQTDYLMDWMC